MEGVEWEGEEGGGVGKGCYEGGEGIKEAILSKLEISILHKLTIQTLKNKKPAQTIALLHTHTLSLKMD